MVHEQATDKPCPDYERHSAARRSGRLSGMIKPLVPQIACSVRHGRQANLPGLPTISKASLCQGVRSVRFALGEVPFGRCGLTTDPWPLAFLAAEYGRRLAAPPGRSSSLRCGRSTWTRGFAGGMVAAIEECPAPPGGTAGPGAGLADAVVGWWRGPGVACPKSRCLGREPATLATESFPGCPPGPSARAAARRASACRQAKMALLICLFSARRASLGVLPSASIMT